MTGASSGLFPPQAFLLTCVAVRGQVFSSFINDFFNNAEDNNQNFGANTVLMQVENLDMTDVAALNTFKAQVRVNVNVVRL